MSNAQGLNPNNVIRIPCSKDSFFRYWIEFLSPFHHLTNREIDVATAFLKERHLLSKKVLDKELLGKILMSEDTQRKVRQDCGLNNQHFQVIKTNLKNKKFFVDGNLNPRMIPNFVNDSDNFQLLLLFDCKDNA